MSKPNHEDTRVNNLDTSSSDYTEITISAADSLKDELISTFYTEEALKPVLTATLDYINERINKGIVLPYFADIDKAVWSEKTKALDIYITDTIEGRELRITPLIFYPIQARCQPALLSSCQHYR